MGYQKQRVPVLSAAEGYELVARSYDKDQKDYDEIDLKHFLRVLPAELAGLAVLDAGGGTGRWAARMAKRGATVTLLDPAPAMLAIAKAKDARIEAVQGSVEDVPFADETFDIAVCAFVLGYVQDLDAAAAELVRVVKPGGLLLVSHNPERKSPLHRAPGRPPFLLDVTYHRPEEMAETFARLGCDVKVTEVRTKKTVLAGLLLEVRKPR